MFWTVVFSLLLGFIVFRLFRKKKRRDIVSVYFGVPGSGKTTFAAWLTKKDLRRKGKVWSNVPITGAYVLNPHEDLGHFMICDGRVIIDEAGIEYNNRDFKKFQDEWLYFFKYHRHYQLAIDIFSQGFDDMDKKIRTLAQRLYVVKKSIFPWFVYRREIRKRVGVNEYTKDIIDEYEFVPFSRKYIFAPAVWKSFNTISRKQLIERDWDTW